MTDRKEIYDCSWQPTVQVETDWNYSVLGYPVSTQTQRSKNSTFSADMERGSLPTYTVRGEI